MEVSKKESRKRVEAISTILSKTDFTNWDVGMQAGQAGVALFLAYYARYAGDEAILDRSMDVIHDVFTQINEEETYYSLCSGIAGPAWTLAHLVRHDFFEADLEELLNDLDDLLFQVALDEIAKGKYDLLHSGLGLGVYFLERRLESGGDTGFDKKLSQIVETLAQVRAPDGPFHSWQDNFSTNKGEGSFNLGLSHGTPSIIAFLGNCLAAKTPHDDLPQLLEESVAWLLAQELPEGGVSCFAGSMIKGRPDAPFSRLAWCYGDLGIASALLVCARAAERADWEAAAIRIAGKAAARPFEQSGVKDAGFCHGAAGVAYIFRKFQLASGDPVFQKAAQFWYDQTLGMYQADTPSGYQFWGSTGPEETDMGWKENLNFLEGLAGVGMTLLIEIAEDLPTDWDRAFLLS